MYSIKKILWSNWKKKNLTSELQNFLTSALSVSLFAAVHIALSLSYSDILWNWCEKRRRCEFSGYDGGDDPRFWAAFWCQLYSR